MAHLRFDRAAKLHRLAHFRGFLLPDGGETSLTLTGVRVSCNQPILAVSWKAVPPSDTSKRAQFEISALVAVDYNFATVVLEVDVEVDGRRETLAYDHPAIERRFLHRQYTVNNTWDTLLQDPGIKSIIDIGGRARSGISRKHAYPGKDVVVSDIVSAPDVDIIADVHEIARLIDDRFDGFMSIATFEHLIMPWKAAIELNSIIREGAVGLVVTHQTVGIHEVPWDFYRYSDQAWKGIFNCFTGFEILDSGMTLPTMIIPTQWQRQFDHAERALGFMTSACVVRKIGEPTVDWPVTVPSITADMYPH